MNAVFRTQVRWLICAAMVVAASTVQAVVPADLTLVRYPTATTTFAAPIGVRAPKDGSGRVFVIERCSGIRVVENGALLPTAFISIANSCGGEQGILGLAFHPDYATNGVFYVTYTAPSSDPRVGETADQVLVRYTASPPSSNVVSPATRVEILRVPDICTNHNGGDLHFSPTDGYLYWSMGDGGVQGDPNVFAQDTWKKVATSRDCGAISRPAALYFLLGKIIRLDVNATTASATANMCGAVAGSPANYAIPPGNPFASAVNQCAEIFNWGFRNPFRFSFDRVTGDMLVGEVGQGAFEEIDYQAAGSVGQNFQWNQCEGLHTYPGGATPCTGPAGSIKPKLDYTHSPACAVIGGNRYRGPITLFKGQYVYSDSCSGVISIVANANPALTTWTSAAFVTTPTTTANPFSFGEDAVGNLYLALGGGQVYRFTSADFIFADGFE